MRPLGVLFVVAAFALSGCAAPSAPRAALSARPSALYVASDAQFATGVQLLVYGLPLNASAQPSQSLSNDGMTVTTGAAFDGSGRLFVVNNTSPVTVAIFAQPVTDASRPLLTLSLVGPSADVFDLAIDPHGTLWVPSQSGTVYAYDGPFERSATISPAVMIRTGARVANLAVDAAGALYVSDQRSNSIAVYRSPRLGGGPSVTLRAPTPSQEGIAVDPMGDLFVGSIDGSISRWNHDHIVQGAPPDVVDPAVNTHVGYPEVFATDALGNLYVGDCEEGSSGVLVFDNVAVSFSATSTPTTVNPISPIQASTQCVAGIAAR